MAGNRSFTDYVVNRFYNELYVTIESYVEKNRENLDLHLRRVHNMGVVSLSDIEVKSVSVNDLPGIEIEFDVILDAEIEVAEGDYHYDDSDLCHQLFLLRCSGNLDCSLNDFEITGINI